MTLRTIIINRVEFGDTKIQFKYYFNGARDFLIAYRISMHLRQLFKPPRLKQIQWSNKRPIEWNDPFTRKQQNYPHHLQIVYLVKWCCRNSKALRFLLNLFEVQKMFIVFECSSLFIVKINFKYFWLSIKCPLRGTNEFKLKCCCCCCYCGGYCNENENEFFCIKKVFWIKLNYDKCWGLVNYTMRGNLNLLFCFIVLLIYNHFCVYWSSNKCYFFGFF